MKFTIYMIKNCVPEWIKLYMNFKLLKYHLKVSYKTKELLVRAKKLRNKEIYKKLKQKIWEDYNLKAKLSKDKILFAEIFKEEIIKVDTFIVWKYDDLKGKLQKLNQQTKLMNIVLNQLESEQKARLEYGLPPIQERKLFYEKIQIFEGKKEILLDSFFRFFKEQKQFESFIELNQEAIKKILKKYKKQMIKGIRILDEEEMSFGKVLKKLNFAKWENKLKKLEFNTEQIMSLQFFPTNPNKCRKYLRRYSGIKNFKQSEMFLFGVFCGYATVFVIIILYMRSDGKIDPYDNPNTDRLENELFFRVFPCFRGMILFILYYWFIILDVYGWLYFKINYQLYLGFNYHFSNLTTLIKRASFFSSLLMVLLVIYVIQVEYEGLPRKFELFKPQLLPSILWVVALFYVFTPTKKQFNAAGRKWMYSMFYGAFWGHFFRYESRFTFFIDQITSMVNPLRDFNYTICYYYYVGVYQEENIKICSGPHWVMGLIPAVIPLSIKTMHYVSRGIQSGKFWCTEHMWNFLKNLLTVIVAFLSYLSRFYPLARAVWIPVAIMSTIWQYWWDLNKDWRFFQTNSRHKFLRDDLGYNSPNIYYLFAILNLFLRASWVLSISPQMYSYFGIKNELFGLFIGFLELFRRFIDNFLKIEKEHIDNLSSLQSIKELKYPFQKDGQTYIELNEIDKFSDWSISTIYKEIDIQYNSQIEEFDKTEEIVTKSQQKIFRLSSILKNYTVGQSLDNIQKLEEDGKFNVDLNVIDKAKNSEILQKHKLNRLKKENQLYISDLKDYERELPIQKSYNEF